MNDEVVTARVPVTFWGKQGSHCLENFLDPADGAGWVFRRKSLATLASVTLLLSATAKLIAVVILGHFF